MTKPIRGAVERTACAYDNMIVGTITVTGFPAQPLADTRTPILEVLVQVTPNEQNSGSIGNGNAQPFILAAGDNVTIKINDLSRVFVGPAGGGTQATFNWIAYI